MTTIDGHDQDGTEDPQFETNSTDDLVELLARAENISIDGLNAPVLAAEFRDAREFVEAEIDDEPELATDGGVDQSEAELHHCKECEDDVPATWDGGVLTCDVCDWVIYK